MFVRTITLKVKTTKLWRTIFFCYILSLNFSFKDLRTNWSDKTFGLSYNPHLIMDSLRNVLLQIVDFLPKYPNRSCRLFQIPITIYWMRMKIWNFEFQPNFTIFSRVRNLKMLQIVELCALREIASLRQVMQCPVSQGFIQDCMSQR